LTVAPAALPGGVTRRVRPKPSQRVRVQRRLGAMPVVTLCQPRRQLTAVKGLPSGHPPLVRQQSRTVGNKNHSVQHCHTFLR